MSFCFFLKLNSAVSRCDSGIYFSDRICSKGHAAMQFLFKSCVKDCKNNLPDTVTFTEDEAANDRALFPSAVTSTQLLPYATNIHETRETFGDAILPRSLLLISSGSCVCRICHTNTSKESLISPCRCKGTLAHVHLSCLERWLNQSCRNHCELCRYHFNAIETPRYRWSESVRIWINYPRNRRHFLSDLLFLVLLTVVTMGLVMVCVHGMRYFVMEGKKIGLSRLWTKRAISFFLAIIVFGYATTVYLLAKDQVSPWYRWWKSTVNVRLVMEQQNQPRHRSIGSRNFEDQHPFTNDNSSNGSTVNAEAETRELSASIDPNVVSSVGQISESQRSTIRELESKA